MLSMKTTIVPAFSVALLFAFAASEGLAQDTRSGKLRFTKFSVPGAVVLGVEDINNNGTISGYYTDSAGDTRGFMLPSGGTVATLIDPLDTATPGFTAAYSIDGTGTIVGQFYDAAATTYSGFFYTNGTFTTYNLPNQPQYTSTSVIGINSKHGFCGFIFPPPYTATSSFVSSDSGVISTFAVNGSTDSECTAMNDAGTTVGLYSDSAGVYHGFIRNAEGGIAVIDVPGASTVPAAAPCSAGLVAGTVINGINDLGEISGHFWDTSNNEHGFLRNSNGTFTQIDVPGAYQTAGGGLSDEDVMVGHWANSSCVESGYSVKY